MKKIFQQTFLSSLLFLLLALPAAAEIFSSPDGWNIDNYGTTVTGLPGGAISDIVSNVAMWMLGIFGFIGVIGFVIAGIFYLTAAGDAEQEKKAKKAMTMSIIGVIVGLLGFVILKAADMLLRASI